MLHPKTPHPHRHRDVLVAKLCAEPGARVRSPSSSASKGGLGSVSVSVGASRIGACGVRRGVRTWKVRDSPSSEEEEERVAMARAVSWRR